MRISRIDPSHWSKYRDLKLKALSEEPEAFGVSLEEEINRPDEYWKEALEKSARGKRAIILGAWEEESLIGIVAIRFSRLKKLSHVIRVSGLYVVPSQRRKGVGKKLMEALLDEAKNLPGISKVKLSVLSEQKPALNLYKSFGFRLVGKLEKEFKVGNRLSDAYLMEKLL